MINKELTCIGCPMGCNIIVSLDDKDNKKILNIEGHTCPIGEKYARNEILSPERSITSSIYVDGDTTKMCSVKTKGNIPKDKIFECVEALKTIKVKAPIKIGDVVLKNVCNTGIDIIATRNVK